MLIVGSIYRPADSRQDIKCCRLLITYLQTYFNRNSNILCNMEDEKNMEDKNNQERILGRLLESSKTTRELAIELGYINPDGAPRYNVIYGYLKRLKKNGYIEGKKVKLGKSGNDPTLYSIIFDIENLRKIFVNHPCLKAKLQKSDSVLKIIFYEYSDLIYNSINKEHVKSIACVNSNFHSGGTSVTKSEKIIVSPSGEEKRVEERRYTSVMRFDSSTVTSDPNKKELLEHTASTFGQENKALELESIIIEGLRPSVVTSDQNEKELLEQTEDTLIEKSKEDLMKKLQLSPEFFRLFLMNNKNELMKSIEECVKILEDVEISVTSWEVHNNLTNWYEISEINLGINLAFEACVSIDVMQGQSNKEAIEYIRSKKKEVSDQQICQLENYYRKNRLAPEFLRGKKLIYVNNSKLQKIEQKFLDNGGHFIEYSAFRM